MSTDLHAALRAAVADEPYDAYDVSEVLQSGARRARRRNAALIGSCALAVVIVVVIASVVAGRDGARRDTTPAHVVRLDIGEAAPQHLDVLSSVRTTWREPMNDLDHDRYLGLTTDGLALRSRLTRDGAVLQLGLTDPGTDATEWLPSPPGAPDTAVELTTRRLVLFSRPSAYRGRVLLFDRREGSWESSQLSLSHDLEVHAPPRLALGPDGRLYLGSNLEDESGPWHWWSYDVHVGGAGRPEPDLEGTAVAAANGTLVSASSDGRVVVTAGSERIADELRPAGCEPPTDPGLADLPPVVAVAGTRPVVTYLCGDGDGTRPLTVVYEADGRDTVQVPGASVLTADGDRVLLASTGELIGDTYLLDLDRLTLVRVGRGLHDEQFGLAGGLILLNRPGQDDAKDVYDVVWEVARVPGSVG